MAKLDRDKSMQIQNTLSWLLLLNIENCQYFSSHSNPIVKTQQPSLAWGRGSTVWLPTKFNFRVEPHGHKNTSIHPTGVGQCAPLFDLKWGNVKFIPLQPHLKDGMRSWWCFIGSCRFWGPLLVSHYKQIHHLQKIWANDDMQMMIRAEASSLGLQWMEMKVGNRMKNVNTEQTINLCSSCFYPFVPFWRTWQRNLRTH